MDIHAKLRQGHVRRWHTVAVAREQTVSDHCHRVGVIAEEVLKTLGDPLTALVDHCTQWAAIHDRHEVITGDLPPHAKAAAGTEFAFYEKAADPEAAAFLHPFGDWARAAIQTVVGLADVVEAANYLVFFGIGPHAEEVRKELAEEAHRRGESACASLQRGQIARDNLAKLIASLVG